MNLLADSFSSLAGGTEFVGMEEHLLVALFKWSNFRVGGLTLFTGFINWLLRNKERGIDEKNEAKTIDYQICVLAWEMRDEQIHVSVISPVNVLCGITQGHSKLVEIFYVERMSDNDLKIVLRFCRKLSRQVSSRYSRETPVIDALSEKCLAKLLQSGISSGYQNCHHPCYKESH